MPQKIIFFEPHQWSTQAALLVQEHVGNTMSDNASCSVMLTGGRSAERLYLEWAKLASFQGQQGVDFYFGDERCVAPDHLESNYGMTMRTLFSDAAARSNNTIHRMKADVGDLDSAAQQYENLLPAKVDVLLLGVGEDGHIASLFPGDKTWPQEQRCVIPVCCPKPPPQRLTVTPKVIAGAKAIFVLATGPAKAAVLHKAMLNPDNCVSIPACMVLHGTWLLDEALPITTQ